MANKITVTFTAEQLLVVAEAMKAHRATISQQAEKLEMTSLLFTGPMRKAICDEADVLKKETRKLDDVGMVIGEATVAANPAVGCFFEAMKMIHAANQ